MAKKRKGSSVTLFFRHLKSLLLLGAILLTFLCTSCAQNEDGSSSFSLPSINLPEGPLLQQGNHQPTPTYAPPAIYDLSGKIDSDNTLLEDLTLVSTDGFLTLLIPAGTRLDPTDGAALKEIKITCQQPNDLLKEKRLLWGQVYTISPENLRLDAPAALRIRYEPPFVDADKDENDALIGRRHPSTNKWEWLDGELDLQRFAVTANIREFGKFSISLGLLYEAPMSYSPNFLFQIFFKGRTL